MEGSAGPANFGQLDPSIVNGSGAGPMGQVPIGSGPNMGGGNAPMQMMQPTPTPGPAAFAMPTPMQPAPQPQQFNPMPQGVQELNAPAESVLLTEMQELKEQFAKVRKITLAQGMALFCIGCAVIFYFSNTVKAKVSGE